MRVRRQAAWFRVALCVLAWSCGSPQSESDAGPVSGDDAGALVKEPLLLSFFRAVDLSRLAAGSAVAYENGFTFLHLLEDGSFYMRLPRDGGAAFLTRLRRGRLDNEQLEQLIDRLGGLDLLTALAGTYPTEAVGAGNDVLLVRGAAAPIICRALCAAPEAPPAGTMRAMLDWLADRGTTLSEVVDDGSFRVVAYDMTIDRPSDGSDALGPYPALAGVDWDSIVRPASELVFPVPHVGHLVAAADAGPLRELIETHIGTILASSVYVGDRRIFLQTEDDKLYLVFFRDVLPGAESETGEVRYLERLEPVRP